MDCVNDISPAEMKPTISTVVTEDDWMTAVTPAPVSTPITRLSVRRARVDFMRSPATALRELAICSMPNRNRARPPRRPMSKVPTARSSEVA